jgi:hypothetical protein
MAFSVYESIVDSELSSNKLKSYVLVKQVGLKVEKKTLSANSGIEFMKLGLCLFLSSVEREKMVAVGGLKTLASGVFF